MYLIIPLNSGRILVNGSSFYCGNSTSNLCQLALKSDIPNVTQYVHPSSKQCSGGDCTTISGHSYTDIINSISSLKVKMYSLVENFNPGDPAYSESGDESFVASISLDVSGDFSRVDGIAPIGYYTTYSSSRMYIHHGVGINIISRFPKTSQLNDISFQAVGNLKNASASRGARVCLYVFVFGI